MLRLALLAVLALPAVASAQDEASTETSLVEALAEMGPAPAPAFGLAAPLFGAQFVASASGRFFDHGWANVELAVGVLGSTYATWLVAGLEQPDGVAAYTYTAALAMNLRLVAHGALSWALYSDGEDDRARRLVPSIAVSPREGGAYGTATWAF